MVGEMHGTKEPAKFVRSLVELLIRNGDTVQVGLEIPSEEVKTFTRTSPDSAIYASAFFKTWRHNYLFIYPPNSGYKYNGIYFTRKVTASPLAYNLK